MLHDQTLSYKVSRVTFHLFMPSFIVTDFMLHSSKIVYFDILEEEVMNVSKRYHEQ